MSVEHIKNEAQTRPLGSAGNHLSISRTFPANRAVNNAVALTGEGFPANVRQMRAPFAAEIPHPLQRLSGATPEPLPTTRTSTLPAGRP